MFGKFSLHVEWTKQWFLWQLTGFYMKEALSKTVFKKIYAEPIELQEWLPIAAQVLL